MTTRKKHWKYLKHYMDRFVIFTVDAKPTGLPLNDDIDASCISNHAPIGQTKPDQFPKVSPILDPSSIPLTELQEICCEADLPYTWIKGYAPGLMQTAVTGRL